MTNSFLRTSLAVIAAIICTLPALAQELQPETYHPPGWNENYVGKAAPEFSMTVSSGENLSSKNLKGKFVVLDFWASWCVPCKILTHKLDSALKKYDSNSLQIIGVNHGEQILKGGNATEYWRKSKYSFPMTVNEQYAKKIDAGFPTVVLIDPDGIIIGYFNGLTPTTAGEIDALIWNIQGKPNMDLATITALNNQGEFIKALYLHDKLVDKYPEQEVALSAQRLRAMLHTNPWMGLNIAKEWIKKSNKDKAVLKVIGMLIAESNVQEKEIAEFGAKAIKDSL